MQITKTMTVGEILDKHPELADTMLQHGLHCVGCHANPFETLEEGTIGHGMSEEQLQSLVKSLNEQAEVLGKTESNKPIVTITETAAKQVKTMLEQQQKTDHGLRFRAVPGGCAGYMYEIVFTKDKNPDDVQLEQHGLKVFVDKESAKVVKGAEVDYVDGLINAGFKIRNPTKSGCGCGSSFGA